MTAKDKKPEVFSYF